MRCRRCVPAGLLLAAVWLPALVSAVVLLGAVLIRLLLLLRLGRRGVAAPGREEDAGWRANAAYRLNARWLSQVPPNLPSPARPASHSADGSVQPVASLLRLQPAPSGGADAPAPAPAADADSSSSGSGSGGSGVAGWTIALITVGSVAAAAAAAWLAAPPLYSRWQVRTLGLGGWLGRRVGWRHGVPRPPCSLLPARLLADSLQPTTPPTSAAARPPRQVWRARRYQGYEDQQPGSPGAAYAAKAAAVAMSTLGASKAQRGGAAPAAASDAFGAWGTPRAPAAAAAAGAGAAAAGGAAAEPFSIGTRVHADAAGPDAV